tara:strand:- start:605 stop:1297 length:693 start_codon:yes stop_codon:yes gene_type:complete
MIKKIFVNALKKGKHPLAMEEFLDQDKPMRKELNKYNLFYVIRPNLDSSVFKIGISNGNSRLLNYINTYGLTSDKGCSGVMLWYLIGTLKTKGLGIMQSSARKKEVQLINDLRPNLNRGLEWFNISRAKLYKAIIDAEKRGFKSKQKSINDNDRKIKEDDRILEVMNHIPYKNNKNKIKKLLLRWSRPNQDGDDTTYENMWKLKRFNDSTGVWVKLRQYAKKHNLTYDTF